MEVGCADYVQIRMCEIAARAPPAEQCVQCVQCVAYLISIGVWEIAANACIFFLYVCLLTY